MKTRPNQYLSYQYLYDYICLDRADLDKYLLHIPKEHQDRQKKTKIEQIKNFFFDKSNPFIPHEKRDEFRIALKSFKADKLEAILYGEVSPEDNNDLLYPFPDDKQIEKRFNKLENTYHLLTREDKAESFKKFKAYFTICKLIGDFVEENNDPTSEIAFIHAYKMLVIFGDTFSLKFKPQRDPKKYFQFFDDYLKSHYQKSQKPIHDTLIAQW